MLWSRCIAFAILFFFSTIHGFCLQDDITVLNGTSWNSDSCTLCQCDTGIVSCRKQTCRYPQCNTTKGESLIIPANQCCPACTPHHRIHCVVNGTTQAHGSSWKKAETCTICSCDNGSVVCRLKSCPRLQCGYGQVEKRLPGHCCSICVSIEKPCTFHGNIYRDGESWAPSKCQRAFCSKGIVVLHVARCGKVACAAGESLEIQQGECCPACVGRSCIHQGRKLLSGEQFNVDRCENCVCMSGEVICQKVGCKEDEFASKCRPGEKKIERIGQCCSECVPVDGQCSYNGTRFSHMDMWDISKCQMAYCNYGVVTTSYVQCTPVQCKWNERIIQTSCCQECVPEMSLCHHDTFTYRHGDTWQGGACERCECLHGVVLCFDAQCSPCELGSVAVTIPGMCCPDCQLLTCHNDCESCSAPGYAHCTSCKKGRFLQKGRCVRRCMSGFYQDGAKCYPCHSSCESCSTGDSPFSCTSCGKDLYLQEGKCVAECQTGYYRTKRACIACRKGCSACTNAHNCSSCVIKTRFPQSGACVRTCSEGYFYQNGFCKACSLSCASCTDASACVTCSIGKKLLKGKCYVACPHKTFQISISRCAECHISCATCSGSSSSHCLTCQAGHYLFVNRCIPHCPAAHFALHGVCQACHESCRECLGASSRECTLCTNPALLVAASTTRTSEGRCVTSCPQSHYMDELVCRACNESCEACTGPSLCSACKYQPDVLLVTSYSSGNCVDEQSCRFMHLEIDTSLRLCFNKSAVSTCQEHNEHLSGRRCVTNCPSNTFLLRLVGGSICLPCENGCNSCQSSDQCDTCIGGHFLSLVSQKCVRRCEVGYYGVKSTGTCARCPDACSSCRTFGFSTQPVCTSCRHATDVLQHGLCSNSCIEQFYPDLTFAMFGTFRCVECDWSCRKCSGPSSNDCLQCMPEHKLQNGTCLKACTDGYYDRGGECVRCSDIYCSSCSDDQSCSACQKPYLLYEQKCILHCPMRYFVHASSGTCVSCPPHCLTCIDANTCTQCDEKTFLDIPTDLPHNKSGSRLLGKLRHFVGAMCMRHCEPGHFANKHTRVCVINRHAPTLRIHGRMLVHPLSRSLLRNVHISDRDTALNDLSLVLDMQPANGWFEVDGIKLHVGERISYDKVVNGGLWFVHSSSNQRHGVASFHATDNYLTSSRKTIEIVVVSKSPPVIQRNNPLYVNSDGSVKLNGLVVQDSDNSEDVIISIIDPPHYGSVVKLPSDVPISSFKIADLHSEIIYYVTFSNASSSDVLYDSITLQITDGYHVLLTVVDVTIVLQNDSSSLWISNRIMKVVKGHMSRITNRHLKVINGRIKDKTKIVYVLNTRNISESIEVFLMVPELSDDPSRYGIEVNDWMQTSQGLYKSRPVIRFSEGDVDEGAVWIRSKNTVDEASDNQESLRFEVFDESGETRQRIASDQLEIDIVQENIYSPKLALGTPSSLNMVANEGRITVLHRAYLQYTDADTPDENIVYTITRSLPVARGSIEHVDHSFVPVTVFTQADVNANNIIYRPSVQDHSSFTTNQNHNQKADFLNSFESLSPTARYERSIMFEFQVSDGQHIVGPATFTIHLTTGNSRTPVFVNQKPRIQVTFGGTAYIGDDQLAINDPDTEATDLIITLVKTPRHGTVIRDDHGSRVILHEGDALTYEELKDSPLLYIHDGGDRILLDQLEFSVTDVTYTITIVVQVSVIANVNDGPYPDPESELSIVVVEGSDVILSRENLAYLDQTSSDDQIVFYVESVPTNGLLENSETGPLVPGASFTQQDINLSKISFRSRDGIGSRPVSDSLQLYVADSTGNELTNQSISITINPGLRHPPTVSLGQSLVVEESGDVMISPHEIQISDVDTPDKDLIINIVRQPSFGYIVNSFIDERLHIDGEEEVWFTVQNMLQGGVYYVHTSRLSNKQSYDYFMFRVNDGVTSSKAFRLNITIVSIRSQEGFPRVHTGVVKCRNGNAILISNLSLSVYDSDTPNHRLVFTVMSQLEYGKLVMFSHNQPRNMTNQWEVGSMAINKNMKAKKAVTDLTIGSTFTYQDILDRKICYETLDPPTTTAFSRKRRDTLDFTLTDGFNVENGELGFDLEPPEDRPLTILSPPQQRRELQMYGELVDNEFHIDANTGINADRGSLTTITSQHLRVSSAFNSVSYVLTRDPNVGQLQLAKPNGVRNLSSNGLSDFTQSDIDQGYLRYLHPGKQGGGDLFFMFDIISGMIDLRFNIHIEEDKTPPEILANNGMTVNEGDSGLILSHDLFGTDDSGSLLYEITRQPKFGRIQFTSDPGIAISKFEQNDIVSELVEYVNFGESKTVRDQFTFILTDGTNSVMQTFNINVNPIDNSLPIVENSGIRVQEGVRKTITMFELKATDEDTSSESVRFSVVHSPQHGTIERSPNGRQYVRVTSFTMEDLYESRISYNHDGTNSLSDRFTFTVSDGTNNEFIVSEENDLVRTTQPQTFKIDVLPVDDGTPRLITNLGIEDLQYIDGKMVGDITNRVLLTEDPDTSDDLISYTVTSNPRWGRVESNLNSGQAIYTFTQADVNMGLIRYVLLELPSVATRDSFMFNVRDSLPNVVTGNTFNIRWSVISFDKDKYSVNEEDGRVDIVVQRRGNTNHIAFVLCRTEHVTASSFSDSRSLDSSVVDYTQHAAQLQFEEHVTEKLCSIAINNDEIYEGLENFAVELTLSTDSLLGNITRTTVFINDDADMPTLQLVDTQFTTEEIDSTISIPIKRTGDVGKPVTVVCYTASVSAEGSTQGRVQSGSDYISRSKHSGESLVTFEPGVTTATCDVLIIDDSLYEDSEEFIVRIVEPSHGSKIGIFSEATVTIIGPNDDPVVSISHNHFNVNENATSIAIPIYRSGSDLSRSTDVWCSTKQNVPASAIAGKDFVLASTKITFKRGDVEKICSITILDDSQTPEVEGNETFTVFLNSIHHGHLTTPYESFITISDNRDDVPTFDFMISSVTVEERSDQVALAIQRRGDASGVVSVICSTLHGSASLDDDYVERSMTETSRVVFAVGQTFSYCNVSLVDDEIFESPEHFIVLLSHATGDQWFEARVGENDRVRVTINNQEDAPTVQFERGQYSIREPVATDGERSLTVRVVRSGDKSQLSKVRCSTRDGSAKSGSDYEPKSRMLRFEPGQTSVSFKVNILSNEDTEWHESFLIVLGPEDPVNALLGKISQTTLTILDKDAAGSLVLPSIPVVVSLFDYDNVESGIKKDPTPGYPLICVTPCDSKYPNYIDTQSLCEEASINASAIKFRWEVAMPTEQVTGIPPFETITDNTPYTSVNTKVLDSIYFGRRFHVRCVAQAVDSITNMAGTPLRSKVVTIGTDSGMCHSPIVSGSPRSFHAQSFIANLAYIPSTAENHPDTLHVSIKIPHQDGRLPLISTMPFSNLQLLLARSIDQRQHVCSNLAYRDDHLNSKDVKNLGFVEKTDYSKLTFGPGFDKPYQFDPTIREPRTIDLYKYLNLKTCIWQFDSYYKMSELIDFCNGKKDLDFQLRDEASSQITVTVPLYVSYVYVTAPRGWGSLDHHTDMQFSFTYHNIHWRPGVITDETPSGSIRVTLIRTDADGRLLFEFETQAKFRGLFVLSHRTLPDQTSRIIAPISMNIGFKLVNRFSESSFDSPRQKWRAVSNYSRKDYTGNYVVELLPCTVSPTQNWQLTSKGNEIKCTAYPPKRFPIHIEFQQPIRPVPVVYTLETKFELCNNDKVFMMDPQEYDRESIDLDYNGAYTKGQTIFGRVLWTPDQDLNSAYRLQLEKVYLCAGHDGYVPYFDPNGDIYGKGRQYGCIEPNKNLQHRFLLLDRSNPSGEDRSFHNVPFDAFFASDHSEFAGMRGMPGVDGFLIKVDALYKVEAGHQWYIQVVYVIRPANELSRARRSSMLTVRDATTRHRRSNYAGLLDGDNHQNGTNMRGITIDEGQLDIPWNVSTIVLGSGAGVVLLLVAVVVCYVCLWSKSRKQGSGKQPKISLKEKQLVELNDEQQHMLVAKVSLTNKSSNLVNKNSLPGRPQNTNINLKTCDVPLVVSVSIPQRNNNRSSATPLLQQGRRKVDNQIYNNLKDGSDSGTEV